jgi:hypothetical protein
VHCGPGQVDLFASANYQVLWYANASGGTSLGSGGNFTTPSINTTTTYYAEAFDLCPSTRTPVAAVIEPTPVPPVGQDALICGTGQAQLSATSNNQIYWYADTTGGPVLATGSIFLTPSLNATTVYYAVANDGCPSNATPVTANVTNIASVLLGQDTTIEAGDSIQLAPGSGFDSYTWSTGDTTPTIFVNNSDIYWVTVTLNGCTQTDSIEVNVILGIQEANIFFGTLNIFPNPVEDVMNIRLESKMPAKTDMILSDMTGKVLIRKEIELNPGQNSETIDVSNLASGVYLLTFKSYDINHTISIVVK